MIVVSLALPSGAQVVGVEGIVRLTGESASRLKVVKCSCRYFLGDESGNGAMIVRKD
jgi:hypothetical protein